MSCPVLISPSHSCSFYKNPLPCPEAEADLATHGNLFSYALIVSECEQCDPNNVNWNLLLSDSWTLGKRSSFFGPSGLKINLKISAGIFSTTWRKFSAGQCHVDKSWNVSRMDGWQAGTKMNISESQSCWKQF